MLHTAFYYISTEKLQYLTNDKYILFYLIDFPVPVYEKAYEQISGLSY